MSYSGQTSFFPTDAAYTAKGQVAVATASGAASALSVGTNRQALMADSTTATGLRWTEWDTSKGLNGFSGWSFDIANTTVQQGISAAAVIQLAKIPLPVSISVTNMNVMLTTLAGGALTHAFAALFKSDGTIIGQTADQSAVWNSTGSTGAKTIALASGPFTVTPLGANDFVWGALYVGTSGAATPKFSNAPNVTTAQLNFNLSASLTRAGTIAQADTANLASITPGSITQAAALFWIALS